MDRNAENGKKAVGGLAIIIIVLIGLFVLINSAVVIIDSGEIGVPVLFGKVQEYTLTPGINVVNPLVKVVKYPVRIQEYTMSQTNNEGRLRGNDAVRIKTSDGIDVGVDMTVWWKIKSDKAFTMYKEIAKRSEDIEPKILRPAVRTVVRDVAAKYKMEDLYQEKRTKFITDIEKDLREIIEAKYLVLDKVLIRTIIFPEEVEASISRKMKTKQQSDEMEYKKEIATKEAEIKEIEAKGIARRQEIINKSLTPLYVQFRAIEIYKELVNSKNTTFVVMPTSPNGTGMPLILNGNSGAKTE